MLRWVTCVAVWMAVHTTWADSVPWAPDLDTARRIAAREGKPLLLHFWSTECGPCKELDGNVYTRASVGQTIGEFFVPVKINIREMPQLATDLDVQRIPTDVIITHEGQVIDKLACPPDPRRYLSQISAVAYQTPHAAKAQGETWPPQGSQLPPGPNAEGGLNPSQFAMRGDRSATVQGSEPTSGEGRAPSASPWGGPDAGSPEEVVNQYASSRGESAVPPGTPPAGTSEPGTGPTPPANSLWGGSPAGTQEPLAAGQSGSPWNGGNDPPQPTANAWGNTPSAAENPNHNLATSAPAPTKNPPLALDGYCPVVLLDNHKWQKGDPRWGAIHRGRTYLFASREARDRFMANPDSFSPMLCGYDPVEFSTGHVVEGTRRFGVVFKKQVFLFTNEENRNKFEQTPDQYQGIVLQAMSAERGSGRMLR